MRRKDDYERMLTAQKIERDMERIRRVEKEKEMLLQKVTTHLRSLFSSKTIAN